DLGDAGVAIFALDELADLEVLDQEVGELVLGGIPAAPPVLHDPDPEPGRMHFLAHRSASSRVSPHLDPGNPPRTGVQSFAPSGTAARSARPISMCALRRRIM